MAIVHLLFPPPTNQGHHLCHIHYHYHLPPTPPKPSTHMKIRKLNLQDGLFSEVNKLLSQVGLTPLSSDPYHHPHVEHFISLPCTFLLLIHQAPV